MKSVRIVLPILLIFVFSISGVGQTNNGMSDSLLVSGADSLNVADTIAGKDTITETEVIVISGNAVDAKIPYQAKDSIWFSVKERKVYLYSESVVNYDAIELKSEYVEMDLAKNEVYAFGKTDSTGKVTGKPQFKDKKDKFDADTLRYNFKTEKGIIKGVITEQSGGYLHGEKTKKQPNGEVHIRNGKYTTCNHEHPHFYIQLTKAKVIPDDKIVTGPALLVIQDMPTPIGLPFGFFPNHENQASGVLLPEYGEELNRGFYLKNGGYYFAFSEYADLQLTGDIYSKKSWGLAAQSNYKLRYKFSGNLVGKYNVNFLDDTVNNKTFLIRWNHTQDPKARPNSTFSAKVDFGSSSFNKLNSNSIEGRLRNTAQSSISYRKSIANTPFNVSMNLYHTQDFQDSTITLKLPVMTLTMNRISPFKRKNRVGKARFYEKIGFTYSGNFSNSVRTKEQYIMDGSAFSQFKNGIKHNVGTSTSFNLAKYITVSPSASYNERWYFESINQTFCDTLVYAGDTMVNTVFRDTISGFRRTYDWDVRTTMSTKLYGMLQFKNKSKINAIRHVLTPTVTASYRPDFALPSYGFYDSVFVDNSRLTRKEYSPYEGAVFGNAPKGKSGLLTFSLNNNLEMKVRSKKDTVNEFKKITLLESFSFNSSYNIVADSLNWSPIAIAGRTRLFNNVSLNFGATADPYAIDTNGIRINTFEWNARENESAFVRPDYSIHYLRFTNARVSLDFSLRSKQGNKNKAENNNQLPADYLDYYVDFEIPWSIRFSYNFNFNRAFSSQLKEYENKLTQTVRVSGDLNLTNMWKIGMSTGYDIENGKVTATSVDIYRDLHCWEMTFNWVPFGRMARYNFTIKAKSSMLQDLKLNKQKSWYDNF